jgi:FAD synthase
MSGSAGVARLSLYPTCVSDNKTIRCHLKDNEAHIYTPDFEVIFVNGLSCYY